MTDQSNETALNPLTALIHSPSLDAWKDFASSLEAAVNVQLPTGTTPYDCVNVLLLNWEGDDAATKQETEKLHDVFAEEFGYICQRYDIPLAKSQLGRVILISILFS